MRMDTIKEIGFHGSGDGWRIGSNYRDVADRHLAPDPVMSKNSICFSWQFVWPRIWRLDNQRRRLAAKAKGLGRRVLREIATIVSPEMLLHRPAPLK